MWLHLTLSVLWVSVVTSTDVTSQVFGTDTDVIPAAFGDFNSDELTDLFVVRDQDKTIEILLGSGEKEPLLKASQLKCTFAMCSITSVVPGDFNGDALMDVLVTTKCPDGEHPETERHVHVLWGGINVLNCSYDEKNPLIKTYGEPLAIDYNNDFIIDLFGVNSTENRERGFWIFSKEGKIDYVPVKNEEHNLALSVIRTPHSNAYLDLDSDNIADLFVTSLDRSKKYLFEKWKGSVKEPRFSNSTVIFFKTNTERVKTVTLGQSTFLDLELQGKFYHVLPATEDDNAKIYVYSNSSFIDLNVNLKDSRGVTWEFFEDKSRTFLNAITLRSGDYNMDGYPDLLATLKSKTNGEVKTFLLENSPCTLCANFSRTFVVQWDGFGSVNNDSVQGAFYDIFQDGILDVILVKKLTNGSYRVAAFKNNLDYDANFVKVMVLTGLTNNQAPAASGPLGKRKKTFGTNLPGPKISYKTFDQDGDIRSGVSAQIPQSAHYSLCLPYTMFALGRTPNFVDNITVGFASMHRDWPQVIPNSQMVIIPNPKDNPSKWKVQLFVTPSKVILMSAVALAGTCLFILITIGFLHWKEKKMDRIERLQEAFRFHFDAM